MKKNRMIEIIARGVCIKGGRLLLCHTKGAPNTYLPGGHVEFNESTRAALEREIREETGYKSRADSFLGVVENVFMQNGRRHCEINLVFLLEIPGLRPGRAPVSREDYIEFWWHDMRSLASSKIEPKILAKVLPQWLKGGNAGRFAGNYRAGTGKDG